MVSCPLLTCPSPRRDARTQELRRTPEQAEFALTFHLRHKLVGWAEAFVRAELVQFDDTARVSIHCPPKFVELQSGHLHTQHMRHSLHELGVLNLGGGRESRAPYS